MKREFLKGIIIGQLIGMNEYDNYVSTMVDEKNGIYNEDKQERLYSIITGIVDNLEIDRADLIDIDINSTADVMDLIDEYFAPLYY